MIVWVRPHAFRVGPLRSRAGVQEPYRPEPTVNALQALALIAAVVAFLMAALGVEVQAAQVLAAVSITLALVGSTRDGRVTR